MGRHRIITVAALSLAIATIGAACGGDDGSNVRSFGNCGGSGSASGSASASGAATQSGSASSGSASSGSGGASCPSGSGSGSGSGSESGAGSGSGIADEVAGSSTADPLVADAVAEYEAWVNTQARLAGEPLEEYIVPEGGGFYFALPGVMDDGRYLGEALFA